MSAGAPSVPAVEVRHLTVKRNGATVLDDVSFVVERGDCLAVIGPNGAGKTTLLQALLGLLPLSEGVVRILGGRPSEVRSRVGYVPQSKGFDRNFPATVPEVLIASLRGRWPARIRGPERRAAVEALDRFGAADLSRRTLSSLSGGELQRVYLARAWILRPELLLLDEPTTGLDPSARDEVDAILCSLAETRRVSMLVITHDLRGLQTYATQAVYLDRRIRAAGDPAGILERAGDHLLFGHVHHDHATPPEAYAPRRGRHPRPDDDDGNRPATEEER